MAFKDKLLEIDSGYIDAANDRLSYLQEDEVAMHHWENNSVVRICDDGCIDQFVDDTVGIRLDPNKEAQSVNIFAPKVNIYGPRTSLRTKANQLVWNGWQFNPAVYQWCESAPPGAPKPGPRNFTIKGDYEIWNQEKKRWDHAEVLVYPYIKDKAKETYSDGMKDIVRSLGLPV